MGGWGQKSDNLQLFRLVFEVRAIKDDS